ncbi:MAG: hypothetical protein ACRYGG_14420 [Janthinobacterium lividum]
MITKFQMSDDGKIIGGNGTFIVEENGNLSTIDGNVILPFGIFIFGNSVVINPPALAGLMTVKETFGKNIYNYETRTKSNDKSKNKIERGAEPNLEINIPFSKRKYLWNEDMGDLNLFTKRTKNENVWQVPKAPSSPEPPNYNLQPQSEASTSNYQAQQFYTSPSQVFTQRFNDANLEEESNV